MSDLKLPPITRVELRRTNQQTDLDGTLLPTEHVADGWLEGDTLVAVSPMFLDHAVLIGYVGDARVLRFEATDLHPGDRVSAELPTFSVS